MRLPLAAWLVTGGFCFFTLTASRAQTTASSPTVWRLNDLQALGGTAVTVVGHPQIVEEPWGKVTHFDGTADGLFLPINPLAGLSEFTLEILFKPETGGPAEQRFFHIQDQASNRGLLEIRLIDAQWALDSFLYAAKPESRCTLLDRTKLHPANQWTWVALVYTHGHMIHYVNGQKELDGAVSFASISPGQTSLGVRQNKVSWFKGSIAEVRIHPQALPVEKLTSSLPSINAPAK